jgi:hypothetical protein
MIELHWTANGADTVELRIDGGDVFATYDNGTRDELVPLTCDGASHTYELVARAGGATARSSLTVATRTPS